MAGGYKTKVKKDGKGMKKERLGRIIEIIESRNVETQEELAVLLKEEGFDVTQATVSRDIRELKLSKVPTGDGRQPSGR